MWARQGLVTSSRGLVAATELPAVVSFLGPGALAEVEGAAEGSTTGAVVGDTAGFAQSVPLAKAGGMSSALPRSLARSPRTALVGGSANFLPVPWLFLLGPRFALAFPPFFVPSSRPLVQSLLRGCRLFLDGMWKSREGI